MTDILKVKVNNQWVGIPAIKGSANIDQFGLETGALSTDAEVLAELKARKISTFGVNKFTKVGTPTITDDGIASDFSSSNYLSIDTNIVLGNDFEILVKFKTGSTLTSAYQGIFRFIKSGTNSAIGICFKLDNNDRLECAFIDNVGDNYYTIINHMSTNTEYLVKMTVKNNIFSCLYSLDNGSTWLQDTEPKSVSINITDAIGTIYIGNNSPANYWYSSIDLKQFSITVDGVEVFNGNKTGIDVIKSDDFTKVGTPTITDDGIASGFSASNYLTLGLTQSTANSIRLTGKFKTSNPMATIECLLTGNANYRFMLFIVSNYLCISIGDGSSWAFADAKQIKLLSANTEYEYDLTITSTQVTGTINGVAITPVTLTSTAQLNPSTFFKTIGMRTYGAASYWQGSIDLNEFKIFVDGNLIYQPCLKIPYTQSKTGSKIVMSTYRDRVQDIYNQFGYAPYYTLSDTDFSLPKGDIYGFTTQILTEYQNGSDGYRIWKDGYCEQWGHLTSGTTVTFAKEFKDTNYNMQPYPSTKSATGCTYSSTTTDWIAKGYLKKGEY